MAFLIEKKPLQNLFHSDTAPNTGKSPLDACTTALIDLWNVDAHIISSPEKMETGYTQKSMQVINQRIWTLCNIYVTWILHGHGFYKYFEQSYRI